MVDGILGCLNQRSEATVIWLYCSQTWLMAEAVHPFQPRLVGDHMNSDFKELR